MPDSDAVSNQPATPPTPPSDPAKQPLDLSGLAQARRGYYCLNYTLWHPYLLPFLLGTLGFGLYGLQSIAGLSPADGAPPLAIAALLFYGLALVLLVAVTIQVKIVAAIRSKQNYIPSPAQKFMNKALTAFARQNNLHIDSNSYDEHLMALIGTDDFDLEVSSRTLAVDVDTDLPECLIAYRHTNGVVHTYLAATRGSVGLYRRDLPINQRFELEGDFAKDYDIYAAEGAEHLLLEVLTPDVMERLQQTGCSVYISGKTLVYHNRKHRLVLPGTKLDIGEELAAMVAAHELLEAAIIRRRQAEHTLPAAFRESALGSRNMNRFMSTPGFAPIYHFLQILTVLLALSFITFMFVIGSGDIGDKTELACIAGGVSLPAGMIFYYVSVIGIGRLYAWIYYTLKGDTREHISK